jgi:hypothetical protein
LGSGNEHLSSSLEVVFLHSGGEGRGAAREG